MALEILNKLEKVEYAITARENHGNYILIIVRKDDPKKIVNVIAVISEDGTLYRCRYIDHELAKEVGIKLDEEHRIVMSGR